MRITTGNKDFSISALFERLDISKCYDKADQYIQEILKRPDIQTYPFMAKVHTCAVAFDELIGAINIAAVKMDSLCVVNSTRLGEVKAAEEDLIEDLHGAIGELQELLEAYQDVQGYTALDESDAAVFKYVMETDELRKAGAYKDRFATIINQLQTIASRMNANYNSAPLPPLEGGPEPA